MQAQTVLIVGSGPAGLFAACELLRHGIRPRIVERRAAPHHEARGTALQPAVLEIIERAGLIEPFLRAGVRIRQVQLLGPGLQELAAARFDDLGCQYPFQVSLPQWRTETILRDHLQALGVTIEYGTEVTSIEDAPDGLLVTLDSGGLTEIVAASYAIGAGGAHSVTRHSMQENLAGLTYGGRYIVADVKIALPAPPETGRVIVGADGFVLLSPLPEDRWLIFVNRDGDDTRAEAPSAAELGALLEARAGVALGMHDLRWVSYFQMHKRTAARLSDGRRFLVGDAGHLSSPLGGEGVNAAFMDAADIAWKLAHVMRGTAQPCLLDSYAVERGAADHHVLAVSDEIHGFVMELIDKCSGGATPSLPPEDPAQGIATARRRSMLDISYAGSAIVGQAGTGGTGPAPGERFPAGHRLGGTGHHLIVFGETPALDVFRARWGALVSVTDGTGFDAAEAGVNGSGAILVRPDGFIGFRAAPADATTIAALDAHLATYLIAGSEPVASAAG